MELIQSIGIAIACIVVVSAALDWFINKFY